MLLCLWSCHYVLACSCWIRFTCALTCATCAGLCGRKEIPSVFFFFFSLSTVLLFRSSLLTTVGLVVNEGHDTVLCLSAPPPQWSDVEKPNNTSLFFCASKKQRSCPFLLPSSSPAGNPLLSRSWGLMKLFQIQINVFIHSNYMTFSGSFNILR